jgi:hypothetical protein
MTHTADNDAPGLVVAIYRQEGSDGVQACTVLEHIAGPKRYARIWDMEPRRVEWGWVLHPTSVKVWPIPPGCGCPPDECRDAGVTGCYFGTAPIPPAK